MTEMLSLFHTGPSGNPECGCANCNDSQAGEQGDRAHAREPRAVQPGPQPRRGCRGYPRLSACRAGQAPTQSWTSWESNSTGLWLINKKNDAPHPRISEGNFKLEYILNSALVRICLVSSTLVSIWTALLFISDLSALCRCLNWVYLTAVLLSQHNHILWNSVFHVGSNCCTFNVPCMISFPKATLELDPRTSVSKLPCKANTAFIWSLSWCWAHAL